MEYKSRQLTSDPGMDQREALTALQTHPSFKTGSIVASIRRRKDQWVAEVLEPKTAEFPPKDDGGGEGGGDDSLAPEPKKDDGPPSDSGDSGPEGGGDGGPEGLDGPPSPDGGGDKGPEGKGKTEDMILHTLTQILHALQGPGAGVVPGGPDEMGPGGLPGGPPPHAAPPKAGPPGAGGPPPGAGGPPGGAMKGPPPMKPGMTPPGGTPVGAPAFASTRTAEMAPVPGGVEPGPMGQQATAGVCPQDGNPEPCPIHSQAGAGLNQMVAALSGRAATLTLTREGTDINAAVAEARPSVENFGYTVKQAKRSEDGTKVHILVSRR